MAACLLAGRAALERNARGRPGRRLTRRRRRGLRDASRCRRRTGSEASASSRRRRGATGLPSFPPSFPLCVPRGKNLAKQSTFVLPRPSLPPSLPAAPPTVKSRTRMPQVERANLRRKAPGRQRGSEAGSRPGKQAAQKSRFRCFVLASLRTSCEALLYILGLPMCVLFG